VPTERIFTGLKRLDAVHKVSARLPRLTLAVRFVTFLVYRVLELVLGDAHPHSRTVRQARYYVTPTEIEAAPRVLFFTVRGWYAHVGTEVVLARALANRGAEPRFFLCGGGLSQCDFKPGSDAYVTRPLCWRCTGFARRMIHAASFSLREMKDVLDVQEVRRRADAAVANCGRSKLIDFQYRGMPIGEYVIPSVLRSLHSGDIGADPADIETLRGFVSSAIMAADLAEALLDQEKPEVVVLTNGLFFEERILLEASQRRGLRVFAYERGIPTNTIITAVNRPVLPFDVSPQWDRRLNRPLSDTEDADLDRMMERRLQGDVGVQRIWPDMASTERRIFETLGLDTDKSLSVLFTNVIWDTAVYRRDIGFDGMFEWLARTISTFSSLDDQQLVIRVHPAEVRLPLEETRDRTDTYVRKNFPVLPTNVKLIGPSDSVNSYELIMASDRVLTYASTIGLEAALLSRTVLVSGDVHYRGRGFTIDVDSPEHLKEVLSNPDMAGQLNQASWETARRYGYAFFFEFNQPFPWLDDRSRAVRRLRVDLLEDLERGSDARIEELCDQILGSRNPGSFSTA
jgi:hypothetical protein